MNLRFWRRRNREKIEAPRGRVIDYSPGEFYASAGSAVKIGAVFRAVQLISDTIGRLPLNFKRRTSSGTFVDFDLSDEYWLLRRKPNEYSTPFIFMKGLVMHVLLRGNAYVFPRWGENGFVNRLVLLNPDCVNYDALKNRYFVQDIVNGVSGTFEAWEILHFKGASLDGGRTGVSVVSFAAQTLGIASIGDRETLERFSSGGKYKAIYHQEDDGSRGFSAGLYSTEEMNRSGFDIEKQINSNKSVIVVPGTGRLDQLSMTSADMQFLESRKFTVEEIARFFGVPLQKIMVSGGSNYKTAELANVEFYGDCLAPLMTMIEEEFTQKLVFDEVRGYRRFEFDMRALYTSDMETRADYQTKELSAGIKTPNELRMDAGLEPKPGGDELFVSANLRALSELNMLKDKKQDGN